MKAIFTVFSSIFKSLACLTISSFSSYKSGLTHLGRNAWKGFRTLDSTNQFLKEKFSLVYLSWCLCVGESSSGVEACGMKWFDLPWLIVGVTFNFLSLNCSIVYSLPLLVLYEWIPIVCSSSLLLSSLFSSIIFSAASTISFAVSWLSSHTSKKGPLIIINPKDLHPYFLTSPCVDNTCIPSINFWLENNCGLMFLIAS